MRVYGLQEVWVKRGSTVLANFKKYYFVDDNPSWGFIYL